MIVILWIFVKPKSMVVMDIDSDKDRSSIHKLRHVLLQQYDRQAWAQVLEGSMDKEAMVHIH